MKTNGLSIIKNTVISTLIREDSSRTLEHEHEHVHVHVHVQVPKQPANKKCVGTQFHGIVIGAKFP